MYSVFVKFVFPDKSRFLMFNTGNISPNLSPHDCSISVARFWLNNLNFWCSLDIKFSYFLLVPVCHDWTKMFVILLGIFWSHKHLLTHKKQWILTLEGLDFLSYGKPKEISEFGSQIYSFIKGNKRCEIILEGKI